MMKAALKKIYKSLPFKKPVFDLVKKIWLPPQNITQHLYFDGFFDVKMEGDESFRFLAHNTTIDNELYWYGLFDGWEGVSQSLWVELSRDAEVIIDVGANDGLYAIASWTVNKNATIVAVEPLDFVRERLIKNIAENGADDIKMANVAFSDFQGTAEMYVPADADYVSSATVNVNLYERPPEEMRTELIETDRFENYFLESGLEKLDLVKMDVESHEPEVLYGFGDLLGRFKPTILAEVIFDRVPDLLNEILEPHGYLYFNIDEKKGTRLQDRITRSDSFNFLICQPNVAEKLGLS